MPFDANVARGVDKRARTGLPSPEVSAVLRAVGAHIPDGWQLNHTIGSSLCYTHSACTQTSRTMDALSTKLAKVCGPHLSPP